MYAHPPIRKELTDEILRTSVVEVCLPITVSDQRRTVGCLTVQNFEVYEDGDRQEIARFIAPRLPLRIALLKGTGLTPFR